MPSAEIDGKIRFPEIVHDPAADRRPVQIRIVPVTQRDGPFVSLAEGNQRHVRCPDDEIKLPAPADDAVLQAPEFLAGSRQLIDPGAHHAAGFVDPCLVVAIRSEGHHRPDAFRVRAALLPDAKDRVDARKQVPDSVILSCNNSLPKLVFSFVKS